MTRIIRYKISLDRNWPGNRQYAKRYWIMLSTGGYEPVFLTHKHGWATSWYRNFISINEAVRSALEDRFVVPDTSAYRRLRFPERRMKVRIFDLSKKKCKRKKSEQILEKTAFAEL